ncbi:DUF4389 domain-containing protein [Marinomonas transparens]|uniref:DUF4389 domain-containing protein n=1 Tax=Marinomonas transparens TaxID=2795388 RepID=A0A934N7W2_9GAMM|nr:DUF4389 domain-containing protein [Marinomonas transparens]MBJ7539471.1 DUF4389 domain-containing protein [Marinomonas transparens]
MAKPGYTDQSFWFRLVFMLVYWVVLNVAVTVFGILLILVSLVKLGSKYEPIVLLSWLSRVTSFILQIFQFMSFETEEKPFPFQPWPQVKSDEQD